MWQLVIIPISHLVAAQMYRSSAHHQWFAMHVMCNMVICLWTSSDLFLTVSDPRVAAAQSSRLPSAFATVLHLYHAVLFPTNFHDMVHHFFFVLPMGVPTIAFPTHASNAALFFLCGLPGLALYLMLLCRRSGHRIARALNEPLISASLNIFLRTPGVIVCVHNYLFGWNVTASPAVPFFACLLQSSIALANVFYYTKQSVERLLRSNGAGRRAVATRARP